MAYLYRHIRLDKNEVFYIGIASNKKRAYSKSNRNKYWHNIVNINSDYKVEIIFDNLSLTDAFNKEKEFISLYGRKDLNLGSLCNLTDGGEGAFGKITSQIVKDKISRSVRKNTHWKNGRKHTDESINKIRVSNFKKVIDTKTGIIYDSIGHASKVINMSQSLLARKLSGVRPNNTNFILLSDENI